jgi:uncharacterized protein (DUF885 family)
MHLRFATPVAVVMLAAACAPRPDSVADLHSLFDEAWQVQLEEYPTFASSLGDHRFGDRLASVSEADEQRRADYWRGVQDRLHAIDRSELPASEQVSYDIFSDQVEDALDSFRFREYLMPFTNEGGFHTSFAYLPRIVPLRTVADYSDYVSRLEAYSAHTDQHIALLREGLESGYTMPRVVVEGLDATIQPHVVDDIAASVFWPPFAELPDSVPEGERERMRVAGESAIRDHVVPSYRRLLEFIADEYLPGSRDTIGASDLPNGREYYGFLVRRHTTLDVSPEEVHAIGLDEVARIQAEMQAIMDEVGFAGGLSDFFELLRTDPPFFAESADQLLKEASFIAKSMDGKLPSLFKTLPRMPYGVEPVPDHLAPNFTTGRYIRAPVGGTRAAMYWVNTYALDSRPLWALPALTLHEAVPGHHLQIALARELTDLPDFRRYSYIDAYGEGWGLYSEWLGIEAGIYQTPYQRFGRLTYEMWRACRLVVDTGMHALGWSRGQAIDFLTAHAALTPHEIATETDRYISWPGQALAYKMGEITIRRLRAEAEEELGDRFDVREFHDVVLGHGPVPLTVLSRLVRSWIADHQTGA